MGPDYRLKTPGWSPSGNATVPAGSGQLLFLIPNRLSLPPFSPASVLAPFRRRALRDQRSVLAVPSVSSASRATSATSAQFIGANPGAPSAAVSILCRARRIRVSRARLSVASASRCPLRIDRNSIISHCSICCKFECHDEAIMARNAARHVDVEWPLWTSCAHLSFVRGPRESRVPVTPLEAQGRRAPG